jgi:hypothetical protein
MAQVLRSHRLASFPIPIRPRTITSHCPIYWTPTRNMTTTPQLPAIKKRAVAGTFLFRYPKDEPDRAEVALFRRSGKVRTYP